jgi:FkbM family methyltransferase
MKTKITKLLERTPFRPAYRALQRGTAKRRFWKWTIENEKKARFYKQFVRPGDVVFDVGANLGNRTRVFCSLAAKVVAFEPNPTCFEFLSSVFRGKDSVHLVNRALGATEGTAEMLLGDAHVLSSMSPEWIATVTKSGRFGAHIWDRHHQVDVTTLDTMIQEFGVPRFIKIDVEGYEREVLAGLSRPIECMSIEFAREYVHKTADCLDFMSSLSPVEAALALGESTEFLTSWLRPEIMKQTLVEQEQGSWGDVYIRRLDRPDVATTGPLLAGRQ